jgi:pseudaminic acid synthase
MTNPIFINGRGIGNDFPPYFVAEMSGNHNNDISRACAIIAAAKASGADAVKLQTYTADTITIDHDAPEFTIKGGLWGGRRLHELYMEASTPWEWHAELFNYAKKIGITIFSTPFDESAVEFLESLNAPAYKIASPELIDLQLIKIVASTGKPVILSTGASSLEEIGEGIEAARSAGARDLIVLHCTAAYPAPPSEANLATIRSISEQFNVIGGLSDHTLGTQASVAAIGVGASFIEKHFTLDRRDGGVDSAFSLEPIEFKELINNGKNVYNLIGKTCFGPTKSETNVLRNRRSLYVVKKITKGELFTPDNIRSIRPANGLKPKYWDIVIGKRSTRDLKFGDPLSFDMISGDEGDEKSIGELS